MIAPTSVMATIMSLMIAPMSEMPTLIKLMTTRSSEMPTIMSLMITFISLMIARTKNAPVPVSVITTAHERHGDRGDVRP